MEIDDTDIPTVSAFLDDRRVATGPLKTVAARIRRELDDERLGAVLIFEDATSRPVDLDWRGTEADVVQRIEEGEKRGPGRPKLGVVSREISLLPRHWEWLATQPGGASVTLRKLVESARKASGGRDRLRLAQEAAYRFMAAMVGNREGFEEALRALYAGDAAAFETLSGRWPADLRDHIRTLAVPAFRRELEEPT